MAKQLNVNLSFTADTSQAAAQVRNLQQSLTQLVNQPVGIGERLSADMLKATQAAAELKMHLQSATNVDTGTLDFGKLNQSLKASGVTLQQYATQLQSLGPQGQQTFMQLARSVANAEVPLRRSNTLLTQFGTTLANTARWQLSSTMLHGFIGAVSTAWNYSKDLNESLNNIRIVTGYNIDQMSKFADQANRAAKALSTTTTEYTNASLIYYQQGLSDAEVLGRTETTIKMANASRQSAEVVSDQMTAIWNNFYDGSKSLEYYADVVTALGAATASSSEEIAQGLEKFAAVADTVGLSYEYATAALATVTATTRQSADVVGTAFKTLFARLSDLKLGETLEDGTTLGTYSENLAKIGVNIKDASGSLKDMDTILNETAAKWDNLDKAQQVALAKGVAGIRQYTQFIALMDNWDFMEKNLNTANSSRGTLEEQAKIYEESWEAASNRVKASLETIYSAIIDDEFFIDLTNRFAGLIDMVGGFVKGIGGLKGVLFGLGTILTKVFAEQMAQGFQNLYYNIQMSSEIGRKEMQRLKMESMQDFADSMLNYETSTVTGQTAKQVYSEELTMQQQLVEKADQLTAAEQQKCKFLIEQHRVMGEQSMELAKQLELTKEQVAADRTTLMGEGLNRGKTMTQVTDALNNAKGKANTILEIDQALQNVSKSADISEQQISELNTKLKALGVADADVNELAMALRNAAGDSDKMDVAVEKVRARLSQATQTTSRMVAVMLGVNEASPEFEQIANRVARYMQNTQQSTVQNQRWTNSLQNGKDMGDQFSNTLDKMGHKAQTASQQLSTVVSGLMSFGMLVSSITGLVDTIKDPDATGWEKFGRILTSVSMIAMSLMGTFTGMKAAYDLVTSGVIKNTAAKIINAYASHLEEKQSQKTSIAQNIEEKETREATAEINKNTAAKIANQAAGNKMQFKGNNGKVRTYSGQKNHKGQLLDDNGQIISNKYVDKYQLNDFGKTPVDGGQAPNKLPKKSLLKPGALKTVGAAVGTVAIVVAAIAATALIIKEATDYWNRHDNAAKSAADSAKRLAENYEKIKEAEQEFRSTITAYEDGVKKMDELTRGTSEYKEALMAANNEALKLLKTNKNLTYTVNSETGLIEIDEAQLEGAKNNSLEKEQLAQLAAISAEQNAKNKQLEADKVKFNREQAESGVSSWDTDDTTVAAGAGGAALALAGGALAIGAINAWNPVGWAALAVGILSAAAAGAVAVGGAMIAFGEEASESEQKALDAIAARRAELGEDLKKEDVLEIALEYDPTGKLGESLAGTTAALESTNEMAKAINENTEAIRQNSELILSQKYGADKAEWLVDTYDTAYLTKRSELEKLNKDINRTEKYEEGYQAYDFLTQYQQLTGKTFTWANSVAANGDEDREFIYYEEGEDGKSVEKRMKASDMIEEMSVAYALQQQEQGAMLVGQMLSRIESAYGLNTAKALANWTTDKNLGGDLTLSNFEDMQLAIDQAGGAAEYLTQVYGKTLEEIRKELGYASTTALVESFTTAMADKKKEFEDIVKIVPVAMQEQFKAFANSEIIKQLGTDAQRAVATSLQSAYVAGGETGYKMMESILKSATSPKEIKALGEALNTLDWSKANPEELQKKIKELGITTNLTTAELQTFISLMSTGVVKMTDIGEKYQSLSESVQDLNLTQEEYVKMSELGLGHYFTKMYNGTYQLVGAAEDFEQILKQIMQEQYSTTLTTAKSRLDEIEMQQEKTTANLAKIGYSSYDDAVNNISTDAVLGAYTGKIARGEDGNVYATKHNAEVAVYHDEGWVNPFWYSTKQVKQVISEASVESKKITSGELDIYNARIDYIEAMGIVGEEMIESWRNSSDMAATEKEILEKYLPKAMEVHKQLATLDEVQRAAILEAEEALLSTAKDSKGRIALYNAEKMDKQSFAKAVNAAITQESWEGLDQEAVASYADYLETYMDIAEESAEEVARAVVKMNKGVESLNQNWAEWGDILKNSKKSSQEYAEAMQNTRNALSDILDVSEEFIRVNFISKAKNMELIGEAAEGSAEAIDALGRALAQDILSQAVDYSSIISVDGIEYRGSEAVSKIQTLMSELQLAIDGAHLTVGENLDTEPVFMKLKEIVKAAQLTTEQANAFYRSMGFTPHFKMVEAKYAETVPLTTTYHHRDITNEQNGIPIDWVETEYSETTEVPGGTLKTYLPSMVTETADGKKPMVPSTEIESVTYTGGGSLNNGSSSNKGGNSGRKTSEAKKPKSDIVDRYKEVDDQLDDVANKMDKISKLSDRLYGANRLSQMQKINKVLKEEVQYLEKKRLEAEQYLTQDTNELNTALSSMGLGLQFTFEDGNISNYTQVMSSIYNSRQALLASFGETMDENEEQRLNAFDEQLDAVKNAITQYDDTKELIEDLENDMDEKLNEWQSRNAEILSFKLELNLSINEIELQEIDYYLNKMSDDFYQMAESAAYLAGGILSDGSKTSGQLGIFTDNLNSYLEAYEETTAAFNSYNPDNMEQRWLSEADYYASLEEMHSGIYDNLNSLLELDKTMSEYYGNTLAAAGEELAKFTAQMENQSAVLDHFSSIMTILGKNTDYKQMGEILKGQSELLENQYEVAKSNFEMLESEVIDKYDLWQKALQSEADAIAQGDTAGAEAAKAAAEFYKNEYDAALAASAEAQDEYLSVAENWAESLKAVLENSLADLDKTLEEALTGGTTFDKLTQSMERAQSLQEEYLTATNKIYETNKLMRKVQQDIDKSTNSVAKKRMQQFVKETQQLQNQSKLSQFELKVQQAKYDLLLAEIALEEAQLTKSTVRLQRDSEGSFGYIYTADANVIADAQQQLADARNALYNIGLEGANDYAQKMIELESQMYEELTVLHEAWMNGEFTSKQEYEEEVAKLEEYWKQKRIEYSSLYQVAITTDSAIIADAWSTDFADMTIGTEEWSQKVNKYVGDVVKAFEVWDDKMSTIAKDTLGEDLNALKEKVEKIKDESKKLRDFITQPETGLLATFKKEYESVKDSSLAYSGLRSEIQKNILEYEKLGKAIGAVLTAQKSYDSGTWHSIKIGTEIYGHYDSAEEAAEAAWNSYYIKGAMSEEEVKNLTIVDRYGGTTTVADYWKESWAKKPDSSGSITNPDGSITNPDGSITNPDGSITNPDGSVINPGGKAPRMLTTYIYVDNGVWVGPYTSVQNAAKAARYRYVPVGKVTYEENTRFEETGSFESMGSAADYKEKTSSSNTVVVNPNQGGGMITVNPGISVPRPPSGGGARPAGMATGGYTGAWGSDGKLAILHEKELVLNADDTTNFLASLEILRDIINVIDLHSMSAQIGGLLTSPYYTDTSNNQVLEQNVHIEASFPGVSDRYEIEEAFNNLVNKASQYVNRK